MVYRDDNYGFSLPRSAKRTKVSNASSKALFGSLEVTSRELSYDGSRLVKSVASDLFESINTPVSLKCEILLRYGQMEDLLRLAISPHEYNCPFKFRDDYQAVSFLKKVPFEVPGIDRKAAARQKFDEAEKACLSTNERIRNFISQPSKASSVVLRGFSLAARKIDEVLGSFSSREWLFSCRFGPGSFNHPEQRGLTSAYDKLQVSPSVTHDFADLGAILVQSSPPWARSVTDSEDDGFWPFVGVRDLHLVPGNRVTFVPKTAVTDRSIAIEPLLNVYAQLGLGRMIRKRLRKVGIDLNSQSFNQEAARLGSIDGSLATIDLSSASDTLAKALVHFLLGSGRSSLGWLPALDISRSKIGELDGKSFVYEKFSSMGNGFTFELETLVFWALSASACEISGSDPERVLVYGDDIVVPVDAYDVLVELLTFAGFTLNQAKSFKSGAFRESCGKDYYGGLQVRPFFQKEVPQDLSGLFKMANGLKRVAHSRTGSLACDAVYKNAWLTVVDEIPVSIRRSVLVPAHAGDTDGLVVDWDYACRSPFVFPHRGGWEGWTGLRLVASPIEIRKPNNFLGGVATLLYRCRDGFSSSSSDPGSPRQGRDFEWKLQKGAFFGPWTNLGNFI